MRLDDLDSPAMEVLNSIKVTIPPELREMLLEFVVCYLIDRPTDPHSYAAAHFMYQQKLRHSYMVRYPHREPGKAPVEEKPVQKAVTPQEKKDRILRKVPVHEESEVANGKKRIFPKMIRIIDDHGRPYGEKLVERVEDIFGPVESFADKLSEDPYEVSEDADEVSGVTSEVSGNTDELSVITDEVSGITDRVSGIKDRVSGITDRVSGAAYKVWGLTGRVSGATDKVSGATDKVSGDTDEVCGNIDKARAVKGKAVDESECPCPEVDETMQEEELVDVAEAMMEEEEVVEEEQAIEPEEEQAIEPEEEQEVVHTAMAVVERASHLRKSEDEGQILCPKVSSADVATHTVIDLLHSTYQTVREMRYSYYHGDEPEGEQDEMVEEEQNAMVEAQ